MLLSKLAYLSIKDTVKSTNTKFTYEAYLLGDFDNDDDFSMQIHNVFTPINLAIHRLVDKDKIPYKLAKIKSEDINSDNTISLNKIDDEVKSVVNVFVQYCDSTYENIPFRNEGINKILLLKPFGYPTDIYIEYKSDIDFLNRDSFEYEKTVEGLSKIRDVDLRNELNISNTACSYIIEFTKGKLLELIDPAQSAFSLNIAEQYFDSLEANNSNFYQREIECEYKIGE